MQYRLSTIFLVFFVVAASLALFGAWGMLVGPVALVMAFLLYLQRKQKLTFEALVAVISFIYAVICLILFAVNQPPRNYGGPNCTNNMKQLGLALWNYHDVHKHFPPIIANDKNGQPLHSWMVTILPHMEYDVIYNQLNRDEPWDSPHNTRIMSQYRIDEFHCPNDPKNQKGYSTNYLAIIGPGTIWRSKGVVSIHDLPKKSLTVAAVEFLDSDKHWAEPYALTVEEFLERMKTGKGMGISSSHPNVVNVLFADGAVYQIPADMPISLWRKLLMGEIKSYDELDNWKPNPDDPAPVHLWINQPPPPPGKWPFLLSILVWLISLAMLFYRAWNSRKSASPKITLEADGGLSDP